MNSDVQPATSGQSRDSLRQLKTAPSGDDTAVGAGAIDVSEKGRSAQGDVISLDRRLFMQLLAFGGCADTRPLVECLRQQQIPGTLYADVHDPHGVALVTFSEDADFFVSQLRPAMHDAVFADLQPKPELTMMGRTYSLGYESDLEETLIGRPRRRLCDPRLPWAIWYPLRRSGEFEQLPREEQRRMLMEHGGIGHAYGKADLAYDIRLACHGLDRHDNDFVVGLLGRQLHPLSAVVQHMRRTRQTSVYLERLGPFFVGRVLWQSTIDS